MFPTLAVFAVLPVTMGALETTSGGSHDFEDTCAGARPAGGGLCAQRPRRAGADPANAPAPISRANWPADVDRQSGFRLPLPKREDLDENGREAYDRGTTPGATTAGLQGPTGIQLYSTKTAPLHTRPQRLFAP